MSALIRVCAPGSSRSSTTDLHLSVLVVGELRRGIERVRAKHARQAGALERWLQRLTREHADRILPIDRRVAEQWGRFSAVRNHSPVDVLMAAHGLRA